MADSDPTPATIAAALAGDPGAWRTLVESTGGYLLSLARRMVRDAAEAEDVVQDIYLRIQRHLGRYDPSRPFWPWLKRLAVNHVLNHLRSRRKAWSLDARRESTGEEPIDRRSASPPAEAAAAERRAAVRDAVAELPEDYRAVVTLRYLGGRSVREVADLLDIPEGTAKIRLYRARAKLEKHLEDLL
jgi:RNA polymerase sigma-70 factor (ECF subfamily)